MGWLKVRAATKSVARLMASRRKPFGAVVTGIFLKEGTQTKDGKVTWSVRFRRRRR